MRLVVDASTLVAEALRVRGRQLIAYPILDLVVAAEAWDETGHEIHKRVEALTNRGHLEAHRAAALLAEVTASLMNSLTIAPPPVYREYVPEARWRIHRDPNDVPTVALALALNRGIWTSGRDFFGCGLPVWTTETLLRYFDVEGSR